MSSRWFLCPKCRLFKAKTFLQVLNHVKVHENEPGFTIECGQAGCRRTYRVVESLKKHLYRDHRGGCNGSASQVTCLAQEAESSGNADDDQAEAMWQDVDTLQLEGDTYTEGSKQADKDFQRAKALFIMKIRDERKLPQVFLTWRI